MPKIIENVREQLLAEAKKQISEKGYADTTVRSVASACGLGIGTVYNYFESKEMLIATFIYEDWKLYLNEMQNLPADEPHVLLGGIYGALKNFASDNKKLFSDSDAAKLAAVGSSDRHKMLRDQISAFILPMCKKNTVSDPLFCADFISEALISWAMEDVKFETVFPLLEKTIK